MDKEKKRVEELEDSLSHEEDVLEEIRDSLKGNNSMRLALYPHSRLLLDKTLVFHDKIEIKQKELQPWTAKINSKQAEIDLATSERDMLARKAEAAKTASKEAQDQLEQLRADHDAKARNNLSMFECSPNKARYRSLSWKSSKQLRRATQQSLSQRRSKSRYDLSVTLLVMWIEYLARRACKSVYSNYAARLPQHVRRPRKRSRRRLPTNRETMS